MDLILNPELKKFSNALALKSVNSKKDIQSDEKYDGYLIESSEKETRRILETIKSKKQKKIIAVIGQDDEFNRRILETCNIDYLVSPENSKFHHKDGLKQRDSGLNHVLAKIANEKGIAIVINFSEISESTDEKNMLEKKARALVLARIIQNIKLCRKAKCKIKIATFAKTKTQLRTPNELKAFAFSLGMSSQQVKQSTEF